MLSFSHVMADKKDYKYYALCIYCMKQTYKCVGKDCNGVHHHVDEPEFCDSRILREDEVLKVYLKPADLRAYWQFLDHVNKREYVQARRLCFSRNTLFDPQQN